MLKGHVNCADLLCNKTICNLCRMRIQFFPLVALIALSCEKPSETDVDRYRKAEEAMHTLLDKGNFFELRDILKERADSISPSKFQFFSAFVQNAFNQNSLSKETIDGLLETRHNLPDSLVAELMLLQRDNYIKAFDYKNAATTGQQLIERFDSLFDEGKIHSIKNKNTIYGGLIQTPPQTTIATEGSTIEWKRDKVGLMTLPVSIGSSSYDFIFDTRAGISVIMKSYAEKLKLRMPGVRYQEGSGITGNTFEAELGIADSLTIGNINVYNVVFQVLPDEILSFPSMDYSIKGIIGFPLIVQWKRFRIDQSGTITLLASNDTASFQNLAFDEAAIVLRTQAANDTLSFYLDSGANHSELFSNFYFERESLVKQTANVDTIEVGGVGGVQKKQVYTLPTLDLQIDNLNATLHDIQVLTKPTYQGQKHYGNIGQDVLSQFKEIVFDFDAMSLRVMK